MMWKLCFAVLAVQVSCMLADNHGNEFSMAKMFLQMMQQSGGDMSESGADPSEILRNYMRAHGISMDDNPVVRLLEKGVEMSEAQIQYYKMLQSFDLVTKAILEDILTNEDGVNDFAKDLVMKKVKETVPVAGELKDIMGMLFDYLMMNPKSENRETIMQLLFHVTAKQSKEDRTMLRVMMLHLMERTYGEQRELVRTLFAALMSEDLGGRDMEPKEMFLLMIQSLVDQVPMDEDKKAMGLMIMHNLGERMDNQAKDMLRDFVMKVIMIGSEPFDIEEDDRWKFENPGPCRVEDSGNTVFEHECPHDFSCDVGPVTYSFGGRDMNYFMCHYSPEYLEYFAFHSCEVTYPGGYVDRRPACPTTTCDFGPFTMNVGDLTYQAKFCSDYSNYTFDHTSLDPKIYRLCALVDPASDLRVLQRRCPTGYLCNGKPHWTEFDSYPMQAVMCQRSYNREADLLLRLVNAVLGYEDEEEPEQGDMMGGDRVANMTIEHSESDFLNYVVWRLWHMMQEEQGQAGMYDMDEHVMVYYALQYLISEVGDNDPLLTRFLHTLEVKYYMGINTDGDRALAQAVLSNLMAQLFERQADDSERGNNAVRGLMALLREHAGEHMRINEIISDHQEEHERMGENLQQMIQMMLGQQPGGGDGEQGGQQGGGDDTEHELIDELLRRLLSQDNRK